MKRGNRFILFIYILAALIYGFHAAVQCGVLALGGTREEFFTDLRGMHLHLSDYVTVRNDPVLSRLFLLNFARGALFLLLLYLVSLLIPFCFRLLTEEDETERGKKAAQKGAKPDSTARKEQTGMKQKQNPQSRRPQNGQRRQSEMEAFFGGENRQSAAASQERARATAKAAARDARRSTPQPRPAQRPAPQQTAERPPQEDYYPTLSAENDNIRVIVKISQTDTEGNEILSFYCGDTVTVDPHPAKGFFCNFPPAGSDSDIRRFVWDTHKQPDEVFYVFDIYQSSQHAVVLKGTTEDALRLLEEGWLLRIYRSQILLQTPRHSRVNTYESKAQETRSVWAVKGIDNAKSRTRRFSQTFYQHDDGIRMEIEVRFKIAAKRR